MFTKCQIDGPVESHPEYKLVVDANNMAVEIDNDINICHKFVRDKYQKRFPELESLVPNALDYLMTVKELGNNLDKVKNNETLQSFLTQATIMVVSVTASTTQGSLLSDEELNYIIEACDVAIEINQCKLKIYQFVESRMTFIAPNVTGLCLHFCQTCLLISICSYHWSINCCQVDGTCRRPHESLQNAGL